MAKLTLSHHGKEIQTIEIKRERTTIGRRPENDIVIDHLAISGAHAAIVTILQDAFLEDLNSTNGTWVNGKSIKKHFLRDGDVIELGKYQLIYNTERTDSSNTTMTHFEQTVSSLSEGSEARMLGATLANINTDTGATHTPVNPLLKKSTIADNPVASSINVSPVADKLGGFALDIRPGILKILNGPRLGKEIELVKTITTLGSPKAHVIAISRRPQGYFLACVEGSDTIRINGNPIESAHSLQENDVIELGEIKMIFNYRL